jgi:hypothetical protein
MAIDPQALAARCVSTAAAVHERRQRLADRIRAGQQELAGDGGHESLAADNQRLARELDAVIAANGALAAQRERTTARLRELTEQIEQEIDRLTRAAGNAEAQLVDPVLLALAPWAAWLDRWCLAQRIVHDPPGARAVLGLDSAAGDVVALVLSAVDAAAAVDRSRAASSAVRGAITTANESADAVKHDSVAMLEQLERFSSDGRPLRIVEDLPVPNPAPDGDRQPETHARLEEMLAYFERVLASYAASAALEPYWLDSHRRSVSDASR